MKRIHSALKPRETGRIVGDGILVSRGSGDRDSFRRANEHADHLCGHRRAFIDFQRRFRTNDPHESLRLFDQQNHIVFLFDKSQ